MLLYIFLLLGAWKGTLGNDDICQEPRYRACPVPQPWRFPETKPDLDRLCIGYLQTTDCMIDHLNKCNPEEDSWRRYFLNMKNVSEDACDKDSQLHLRIVQNLDCFNEVVEKDSRTCRVIVDERRKKMFKYVKQTEAEKGNNDELRSSFQCLVISLKNICYASKSNERCGSDARDIVLEVNRRAGFPLHCSAESITELLLLIELEPEEEALLNQIIDRE
ncbi:uncharacterized protein LOC129984820 [Argiope bruennichi]|uniref:uncharacterized protein LOC129984820 n=1 Tax=Argiope bruennichi TaxID=94029 RepID=UPI00249567EA|nr:uncharacterized protein LOC129984820 [Argiope bruennichi]